MKLLIAIDRDGTLIKNDDFFGRSKTWQTELRFNADVIDLLSYLQTKHKTTKIVVTNQSGVARRWFTHNRVEEINRFISKYLKARGVTVNNWQYCPDVDANYAKMHTEHKFNPHYIKIKTKRKPDPAMIFEGLKKLKMRINQFDQIIILGDRNEDAELAKNVNGKYLDVKNKTYNELCSEFTELIT